MIKSDCHDSQAENYDKNLTRKQKIEFDYIRENYFAIHDRVIELLNLKKTDRILDIGIGTALLEEKIDKKCFIAGIDISGKMLEKAMEKSLSVEYKKASFLDIPYPDETFDSVISCFAFHHLTNIEKEAALKEIARVLKQDGKFIIADFMYGDEEARKLLEYRFKEERREDMIEEMSEENYTNIEWLINLLDPVKYEIKYEQVSTISWIVGVCKSQK